MTDDKNYICIFAKRLKDLRVSNNLTVRSLGEQVGLTGSTISRYENGEIDPRKTAIQTIANYFGVNPVWLMGASVEKYISSNRILIPILKSVLINRSMFSLENIEKYESVEITDYINFCLRVKDDSMITSRIIEGDIVYVQKQETIENGELALILINKQELLIRRAYKVNGIISFRSDNPKFKEIILDKKDKKDIKILGRVKAFKSNL